MLTALPAIAAQMAETARPDVGAISDEEFTARRMEHTETRRSDTATANEDSKPRRERRAISTGGAHPSPIRCLCSPPYRNARDRSDGFCRHLSNRPPNWRSDPASDALFPQTELVE